MATTCHKGEVYLGDVKFPLTKTAQGEFSRVNASLISQFPGKVVIGDYSLDTEQLASNWIISDQRGGIGVEEMDEKVHQDRDWFSTCNTGYKGHIILPPLATQLKAPYLILRPNAAGSETALTPTAGANYECVDEPQANDDTDFVYTNNIPYFRDLYTVPAHWGAGTISKITICWRARKVQATTGDCKGKPSLRSNTTTTDGTEVDLTTSWVDYTEDWTTNPADSAAWEWADITALEIGVSLNRVIATDGLFPQCTQVYVKVYADDIGTIANTIKVSDELSEIPYFATTTGLERITTAGTAIEWFGGWSAVFTPTDAIIFTPVGDSTTRIFVCYTSGYAFTDGTAAIAGRTGAFTVGKADAVFFVEWDSKLFKIDVDGQLSYSTNPENANPTWTNNGKISKPFNNVTSLFLYRDADGEVIIYAGTDRGVFAHDYTNAKFIETELVLAPHSTAAKGAVHWREALYLSAGLGITKYIAASTATISFMGLDRDDGLPADYRGEITQLIGGYNEFYALVDSSLASGTNYSSVMAFDSRGWQTKWVATTADDTILAGLVGTGFSDYRLWWVHNNLVYYIKLEKDIHNPLKITSYPYAASGIHITPWFDGGWIGNKLALAITLFAKDTTVNETVEVSYRIDHSSDNIGAVDTEWTSLGTLVAANDGVEKKYTFGTSAVGLEFKSIQFRFDLARGSTTTLTPDLQYAKFKYLKLLDSKWGWSFSVDCSEKYGALSAAQLIAKIATLAATGTLISFIWRTDTSTQHKRVKISSVQGLEDTGEEQTGQYSIAVVSP